LFVRRKYNNYLPGPSNNKVRMSPSRGPLGCVNESVIDSLMAYLMGIIFFVITTGVLKLNTSYVINVERLQIMLGLPSAF
jgi:hypothetical protein